jgi:hypothetical protein
MPFSAPQTDTQRPRSASELGSEVTRLLVADRSAMKYIDDYTKEMKEEILKFYPSVEEAQREKIVRLAFEHSGFSEAIQEICRHNEQLIKTFATLAARNHTVEVRCFYYSSCLQALTLPTNGRFCSCDRFRP